MRKVLRLLHGDQFTATDLQFTYLSAGLSLVLVTAWAYPLDVGWLKHAILSVIVLDFSGGMVANMTTSTSIFYASRPKLRILFIGCHVIQPLLLAWIFECEVWGIAVITTYTLAASLLVSAVRDSNRQRTVAMSLFLPGISLLLLLLKTEPSVLTICLIFFMVKLIVSFPVHWGIVSNR